MDDYYKRLGVSRSATLEEIKKRWKDMLRDIHPDVRGESTTGLAAKINEAYMTLRDAEKRQIYDAELRRNSRENTEGSRQTHGSWAGVRRTPEANNPTPPVDNRPIDEKYKEVRQKMDKINDEVDKRLQEDREEGTTQKGDGRTK